MNLAQRFRRLSFWNKLTAIGSLASIAGLALWFILHDGSKQEITIEGEGDPTVYQAGRDINVVTIKTLDSYTIESMSVEARLTCDTSPGAELPPSEVENSTPQKLLPFSSH